MSKLASASPRALRVLSTVVTIGWVSWVLFIVTTVIVTSAALLERRTGTCASEGSAVRNWVFELVPFAQLCAQPGSAQAPTVGAFAQTVFVGLALLVAIASSAVLIANAKRRGLSKYAAALLTAQAASVVLAGPVVARSIVIDTPSPISGADIGLVWGVVVACALATIGVIAVRGVVALVRLGRNSS